MQRSFLVWAALIGVCSAPAETPRQAIKRIVDETLVANRNRNPIEASSYMAGDYYLIMRDGTRVPRSQRVQLIARFFHDAQTFTVTQTLSFDSVSAKSAVTSINYVMSYKLPIGDKVYSRTSKATERSWWELRKDGWKVAHSQILHEWYKNPKGVWILMPGKK